MKKLLLLLLLVAIAIFAVYRQRIYVRDPVATVTRNDVKQSGAEVYVNVSDDVLLWQDAETGEYSTLLQAWDKLPGIPYRLTCLRWLVCVTDADHASIIPLNWNNGSGKGRGVYDPAVTMTVREVSYMDADGETMRMQLR
jgi:hypothetical protein